MRQSWLVNLLLCAAVAITGSRFWSSWQQPLPGLPAPPPAARIPTPPEQVTPGKAGDAAKEIYDIIVARDLFSPARGIVAATATKAAGPAAKPLPPPKLTLYGVVILDAEKTAFLQEGTQETKPRRVREGEAFAGGKVSAIRPDGISFLFAGNEVSVPLRTPKENIAPPQTARQPEQPAPVPTPQGALQQQFQTPQGASAPQFQTPQRGVPPQIRPPGVRVPSGPSQPGQGVPTSTRSEPPRIFPPGEATGNGEQEYFQPNENFGEGSADEGEASENPEDEVRGPR